MMAALPINLSSTLCSKALKWQTSSKIRPNIGPISCNSGSPLRRSANYQPTLWSDDFIQPSSTSSTMEEKNDERIKELKKKVVQFFHETKDTISQLELIDELEQLGVAYHFKDEIHNALWSISIKTSDNVSMVLKDDLSATCLLFRLLRQHGFDISEDIFNRYKDEMGNFIPTIIKDVKGMLNLYEASCVANNDEREMDRARVFSTTQLSWLLEGSVQLEPRIKNRISYVLELPVDWRIERLHNRWFIQSCQARDLMNPILLEFAILDHNAVQVILNNELNNASRWWTDVGLTNKTPFARDRLIENYFWAVGSMNYEPQHNFLREALTKANCLITTIDDIYDLYGTLEELETFTTVINRWDVNAANDLPEYMKHCFFTLLNTINETSLKVIKEKGLDVTPHLKKVWVDLCNAYFLEAKWWHGGYKPNLEEYLENAWISISGPLGITLSYCLSEHVTKEDLERIAYYPDFVKWSSIIFRLCNDLATSKDELQRGDVLKSVQCYMEEKHVSEVNAREHMKEIIAYNWKLINGKRTYSTLHEKVFKDVAINFARTAHCVYQYGDGYGKPDQEIIDKMTSVLVEPIHMLKNI